MSSRTLTSSMQAEVTAQSLRPILFYEGEFIGGTLRMWTGVGTLVMSGQNWTGAGQLMSVEAMNETTDNRAEGIALTLSGMPSSLISTVLGSVQINKAGKLWFGVMTGSNTVVSDPYLTFQGKLDQPSISDDGQNCNITVRYESQMVDLQRPRVRHFTPEDQNIDYPLDQGFDFVALLQDKSFVWGPFVRPYEERAAALKANAPPTITKYTPPGR